MKAVFNSILIIVCVCVLGCAVLFFLDLKTQYADGYTRAKFNKIRIGMSPVEVVALIGKPLRISTQNWSETWRYLPVKTNQRPSGEWDFQLEILPSDYTWLCFSSSGTVIRSEGEYLKRDVVGLAKDQLIADHGLPSETNLTEFVRVFHYSGSKSSGDYLFRNVHFDSSNRVVARKSGVYLD